MRRNLSSAWTVIHKVVFPAVWIGGFALGTACLFLAEPRTRSGAPPPPEMRWFFLAATVLGSAFLYWFGMRLKKVALDGDRLIISEFGREIEVPLRDVERVTGSILMNPELIWLRFRRPTEFGTKIVFMPTTRFLGGYSRHPLVEELRTLVAQASGAS
jgi:hypothetical protein